MKKLIALLLALVMVLSLVACGSKTEPAPEAEKTPASSEKAEESTPEIPADPDAIVSAKDTLVIAAEFDAGTLAPTGPTVQTRTDIIMQVYEGLFRFDGNNEMVPQLATSWEQTDDTHYTVHLREGVKYHDGRDFTAKDVLFTLKLNCEDANTTGVVTNLDLANCKAINDYTVELAFTKADSFNWTKLCYLYIVNEESYNESPDGMATHPIGTGPYKFESSVPGASYTLVANEDYRDGAPYIKNLTVRVIPEASQRTNALEMGEVDVNMSVQTSDYAYFEGKEGYTVERKAGFLSYCIFFNLTENSPIGQSKELRHAVCYATDNQSISTAAFGGLATPNTMVWSSGMIDYDPSWTNPMYGYDMEASKALVAAAGAPANALKVMYDGTATAEITAQILQASLLELGIACELVSVDPGVMWSNMADQTMWDLAILGASAPSGYGLDSMTAFLTGLNFQGWSGEKFDEMAGLCAAGSTAKTEEDRISYTKQLWELIAEEVPLYGMVTANNIFAYDSDLNFKIFDQYSYWAKDFYFAQ